MDIDTFIHEAIFGEKEQHRIFLLPDVGEPAGGGLCNHR